MTFTTSEQVQAHLCDLTRKEAVVTASDKLDGDLPSFVEKAFAEHMPSGNGDFLRLPEAHFTALVVLAASLVCFRRAMDYSAQPSLKLPGQTMAGFGSDRDTPHAKSMAMYKALLERYAAICDSLGYTPGEDASGSGEIVCGQLFRAQEQTGLYRSPELSPIFGTINLSSNGQTFPVNSTTPPAHSGANVVLVWNYGNARLTLFERAYVFYAGSSAPIANDIRQPWIQSGASNIPQIHSSAELAWETDDPAVVAANFDIVSDYYHRLIVVVKDKNGSYTYSNELYITTPIA